MRNPRAPSFGVRASASPIVMRQIPFSELTAVYTGSALTVSEQSGWTARVASNVTSTPDADHVVSFSIASLPTILGAGGFGAITAVIQVNVVSGTNLGSVDIRLSTTNNASAPANGVRTGIALSNVAPNDTIAFSGPAFVSSSATYMGPRVVVSTLSAITNSTGNQIAHGMSSGRNATPAAITGAPEVTGTTTATQPLLTVTAFSSAVLDVSLWVIDTPQFAAPFPTLVP